MTHPARYIRPKRPRHGLRLQARDFDILDAVRRFRALRTEHLSDLLHPVGRRVLQGRLRLLWEHRLLDRRYLPAMWGGEAPPVAERSPLYLSTSRGLRHLAEARGSPERDERVEVPSVFTLAHDLVATDFLIALESAARRESTAMYLVVESEHLLRRRLAESSARPRDRGSLIVPDGAATISSAHGRQALHLEVVRAGARSGNGRIVNKLARYGELVRDGFFERAYGHARLRAVLIATTSERRAETLRALAEARLPRGSHWLFWFGSFDGKSGGARYRPETVAELAWKRTDGSSAALDSLMVGVHTPTVPVPP